ncbi:hypothetical protein PRIPAC_84812 [Pristionchus pacificus]|uniref:Uncharacterized protein n=1 Tax=Pristionchus pacificus TaxID=54126 RepID=A0A2A6BL58_PRIPA|nr:hypothetical protein PRIPAC_84812 [Pristionchus pacificus]|eukprot:PDM66645.1 hypothetical protein PRIPAC_48062 [Pristionchus pacificus]
MQITFETTFYRSCVTNVRQMEERATKENAKELCASKWKLPIKRIIVVQSTRHAEKRSKMSLALNHNLDPNGRPVVYVIVPFAMEILL